MLANESPICVVKSDTPQSHRTLPRPRRRPLHNHHQQAAPNPIFGPPTPSPRPPRHSHRGRLTDGPPNRTTISGSARALTRAPATDVGHIHFPISCESPGDRRALLLAARQLRRQIVHSVLHPDSGQVVARRVDPNRAMSQPRRQHDVLQHRERRQQVEMLEHDADPLATKPGPGRLGADSHRGPLDEHLARGHLGETPRTVQQGALPRPRWPHHGHERTATKPQRHAVKRADGLTSVALVDLPRSGKRRTLKPPPRRLQQRTRRVHVNPVRTLANPRKPLPQLAHRRTRRHFRQQRNQRPRHPRNPIRTEPDP